MVAGESDADVADAPTFASVLSARLGTITLNAHLLVYNAPFDVRLLRAEVARAGAPPLPQLSVRRTLDPLVWVRDVDRFVKGKGRHQLGATAARWKVPATGRAHGALVDCRLTAGVARALAATGRIPRDVPTLLRRQAVRRAAQEADFAAYWARTGAPA